MTVLSYNKVLNNWAQIVVCFIALNPQIAVKVILGLSCNLGKAS